MLPGPDTDVQEPVLGPEMRQEVLAEFSAVRDRCDRSTDSW